MLLEYKIEWKPRYQEIKLNLIFCSKFCGKAHLKEQISFFGFRIEQIQFSGLSLLFKKLVSANNIMRKVILLNNGQKLLQTKKLEKFSPLFH